MFFLQQMFWCACGVMLLLNMPPLSSGEVDLASYWSKIYYSLAFGGLTINGLIAYRYSSKYLIYGLVALAFLIELLQWTMPWQQADIIDLIAALVGITVVRMLWAVAFRR